MSLSVKEMIRKADARFREELYKTADMICADTELNIVRLSGPTCAGKTTAAKMLVKRMAENGKNAVFVSIDDFYYDCDHLEMISRENGFDGLDYDSPATIDTAAMAEFIGELRQRREAICPRFDFSTGKREQGRKIKIGDDDILIFEGIQAVYEEIIELFGNERTDCIFISPTESIVCSVERFEPNEIRLMRRIVRDSNFRDTNATETMSLWKSVRENEEKHIFPNVPQCKYRINSTMPYEIGVLRPYLEKVLSGPSPYRSEFDRMLEKIKDVESIPSSYIDEDSLYKEFV
ncbi:MAG: hypothetical protein IKL59_05775 [Clostridia bacterium]|nr:hypothetical protein [Clostridia bacterium]